MTALQNIEGALISGNSHAFSDGDFRAALLIFRRALSEKVASTSGKEHLAFTSSKELSRLVKKFTGIDPFCLYEKEA